MLVLDGVQFILKLVLAYFKCFCLLFEEKDSFSLVYNLCLEL